MKTWSGLFTPLITPFKSNRLDSDGLMLLIEKQRNAKVDGLVFLGTTAETLLLSDKEKKMILHLAKTYCKNLPWIAGTGYPSTCETIEKTQEAAKYGASMALVCPPYYIRPTQQGLIGHYFEIADNSPIPIILYNNPGRAGVLIEEATIKKCAEHPKIIGLKESGKQIDTFRSLSNYFKTHRSDFWMIAGDDSLLFDFFQAGAKGVISPLGNLFPDELLEFTKACLNLEFNEAAKLLSQLQPIIDALNLETNPITLKFAMKLLDLPSGNPRAPLTPLSSQFHFIVKDSINRFLMLLGAAV